MYTYLKLQTGFLLTVVSGLRLVLGPRLLLGLCELLGHRFKDGQKELDVVVGNAHVQRVETYLENEEIGTLKVVDVNSV